MKSKFFTAESREAAEAMAGRFFDSGAGELIFETVGSGEENTPVTVIARQGTQEELRNSEGFFRLYYEEGGVYLEMYPPRGAGKELEIASLTRYLNRKNLESFDATAIQSLLSLRSGRVKIAPAQKEIILNEDISVEISQDETKATAFLLEPEPGGEPLSYEAAEKKIIDAGVTKGLISDALTRLLKTRNYGEPAKIAETVAPINGEDARIVFHFSRDERTGRPREIGGGRVDLRSLDLYEPVTEGQLLVTKIEATEGTPGALVTGKEIAQKPGKDANIPKGKNVDVNPEKTEMRAKCSGMVEFINNSVNVSSVYKIDGDCDISVGNIDFDGSVHVSGSVRSGNTIKASGGIVVGGAVEAATLIAGGNVEVKGGMQGADKGRIETAGSVTVVFIERGAVVADGSINLDVSIHSKLEAGGSIIAKGKRGAIIGGRAGAVHSITANCIGAVSRATTEIEVGVMPRKRAHMKHLEKEIERYRGELVKLDQLDTYLENSKEKMDPETWDKLHRSGAENRRIDLQFIDDHTAELEDLKYELEHATDGRIHVLDTVFEGSKLIIGNGVFKVSEEIKYASFRYKDAEVVYGSCEVSNR